MKKLLKSTALVVVLFVSAFLGTTHVQAHSVWIESTNNRLVVRFAEPGDDFETSPGYLDNLSPPIAFSVVTNAPVAIAVSKKADYFLLEASPTNTACVETSFTVRGGRKPNFYARWQPSVTHAAAPLLTLDIVPTGKAGEARAYFRGQPLGGAQATLRAPDRKETTLTADADGLLHFVSDQAGQYLLTIAHHREPLAGFHNGISYKETSHNCSLVWLQSGTKQSP